MFENAFQTILNGEDAIRFTEFAQKCSAQWIEEAIKSHREGTDPLVHIERVIKARLVGKAKGGRKTRQVNAKQPNARYEKLGKL